METLLKNWREAENLTIPQAAEKIGAARATWWRWEKGTRLIGLSSLATVERVTGIKRARLRPDIFGAS